jgi:hypothetical protein
MIVALVGEQYRGSSEAPQLRNFSAPRGWFSRFRPGAVAGYGDLVFATPRILELGGRLLARRPLILMVAVIVMAAWSPQARAAWSAPATISTPHDQISALVLASGPTGDLLAWKASDLIGGRGIFGALHARYAVARARGSFGPERGLPISYAGGPLVNLGGGRVGQLILLRTGTNTTSPRVALGGVDGRFGTPQAIRGASVFVGRASLAGNSSGDLLLAWIAADSHGGHRVVWASTRPAGGHFGGPQVISRSAAAEQVTAAVGRQGDMVVAFASRQGRMLARVRRHQHSWGSLQDLGPAAVGTETDVTPFVGDFGRIIVAWYHTQLCEGGCVSPGYTRVAVQLAGASRFRAGQLLERDRTGLAGAPSGRSLAPTVIAISGNGPMVIFLAPVSPPAANTPLVAVVVKVADSNGAGFAAPRAISPAAQQASDVAASAGPNGTMITWIRDDPPGYYTGTVFAAVRQAGAGRLSAPEQVSPSEYVNTAVPTYSPGGGRWIVAWAGRPQYRSALTPGPMFARESVCQAPCR